MDFHDTRKKVLASYTLEEIEDRNNFLFLKARLELTDKLIKEQSKERNEHE